MRTYRIRKLRENNGAVLVLIAFLIFVFLGIAAFTIDLGYRHIVRNELQNAADAAALAAANKLGSIYTDPNTDQQGYTCNRSDSPGCKDVVDFAVDTAYANYAGNVEHLTVDGSTDVLIGRWWTEWKGTNPATRSDNLTQPNAVMVRIRRDGSNNGPISTFFAAIFNIDTIPISAIATAALSGLGSSAEVELPVGLSKSWFDAYEGDEFCGQTIKFSPTTDPDACAGWNTFTSTPANDNKVGDILNEIEDGENPSPYTDINTSYEYINGDLSEGTYEDLMLAHKERGYDVDAIYDPNNPSNLPNEVTYDESGNPINQIPLYDTDGVQLRYPPCSGASGNCSGPLRYAHEWHTSVVVYDSDSCTPNTDIKIWGFVNVVIYDVGQPGDKSVKARIQCDYVQPGRGGGSYAGTYGDISGLVE